MNDHAPRQPAYARSGGSEPVHLTPSNRFRSRPDESELVAGLWQESCFSRLPNDAPQELREYIHDIDNPRRVYAVHRASRRHGFQLLVERYVYQLRNGCSSVKCTTPTCFTCRKRLAGKSPIRRYNPTSARTLAVYLASQDDPEKAICPNIDPAKYRSTAANGLIFSAQSRLSSHADTTDHEIPTPWCTRKEIPASERRPSQPMLTHRHPMPVSGRTRRHSKTDSEPTSQARIAISEKPVSRDYRSFAAAAFGTAAFKMLEWLTPLSIQEILQKMSELGVESLPAACKHAADASEHEIPSSIADTPAVTPTSRASTQSPESQVPSTLRFHESTKNAPYIQSDTKRSMRSPSSPKVGRGRNTENLLTETHAEDDKLARKTPGLNGFQPEKLSRVSKFAGNVFDVPEIPHTPALFETVPNINLPVAEVMKLDSSEQDDFSGDDIHHPVDGPRRDPPANSREYSSNVNIFPTIQPSSCIDLPLPQTLYQLNVELVDFMCDVFQEDQTFEKNYFETIGTSMSYPVPQNRQTGLIRRRKSHKSPSRELWRTFNEQSIFHVLSDPRSLVRSFTKEGGLYDSHTLWYCMLRMTRVAPSLVFHSLWIAAGSLFTPPKRLRMLNHSSRAPFGVKTEPLSRFEAGCVLSMCFHALVAAAPAASDSKTMYEMSRIRSNGVAVPGTGPGARQPSICLEYDDVFSNDLAIRLARRLFCAITAQRCFSEMACEDSKNQDTEDSDILQPLLDQLDLLSAGPVRILEFSHAERLLHETRVPTQLLDWARAILLHEWNGFAEFSSDGPFHGALSLIATMYEKRNILLLGDIQFRVDYLSDRLDTMEMPVAWAAFKSTKQRCHILDYPYLFSPDCLVSFFRSINFSKMSRMFEESSSLKTRMSAIVDTGSLITNPHHKVVLQDLLRTASSKYLVLEISRENVLRDAFDQLWRRQQRELLRPLKVHLGEGSGEEGFDSGGVQQEFFRMAFAECLDPRYGAFSVDERTRMTWFIPGSTVETWKFEMIGLLMSLAVYNGLTLPITFPKALYRKLLGQPVEDLYHIADGWPDLAGGLTTLLEWDEKDGLIEDVFTRTYEFSVSSFGRDVTLEMTRENSSWPQGPGLPNKTAASAQSPNAEEAPFVTNDNRDQYVSDYVRYLTDVSVQPQYVAFERGFRVCLDPKSLTLLNPLILQSIVEGVQDIDISELRRCTRYVGWDTTHHTIKDFWSVVKRYDDEMKRKLLEFVTASDRVPVGGMRNLQFVIQRNGEEEGEGGHLPTAYTCYGTLLLPEYRDRDVLRERLGMALQNAQGFGFA